MKVTPKMCFDNSIFLIKLIYILRSGILQNLNLNSVILIYV